MLPQSFTSLGAPLDGSGPVAFDIPLLGRLFDADDAGAGRAILDEVDVSVGAGIVLRTRPGVPHVGTPAIADPLRLLMEKVKMGDQAAFRELHRACAPRVHAFVQRIVKRHELADEVASTVFMQVWRDAARFDAGRGCTFAWICAIARSRSLDMLRQVATRQRHEEPLDDVDSDNTADAVAGPHELLQSMRLRKILGAGLARLTPAQRHILRLTFFEGLSHEEVAATASLPLGTVKSHARRGLAALRENSSIAAMAA